MSEVEKLKAGDKIGVEIEGKEESIILNAEQAACLNEQIAEDKK
jgi:hypothetical protein